MSAFHSALVLIDNEDGRTFRLAQPLVYESDRLGKMVVVPAETVTDLASIPLLSNHRRWSRAAVIHDWLYQTNGISRAEADDVLGEAMKVCGVPRWRRWIVLSQLNVWGWRAWNGHRAKQRT